jgi:hypothetical protein
LHVVGRHDENVIQGYRLDIACFGAVGLFCQPWDQFCRISSVSSMLDWEQAS